MNLGWPHRKEEDRNFVKERRVPNEGNVKDSVDSRDIIEKAGSKREHRLNNHNE